jgi:hypothetical protein
MGYIPFTDSPIRFNDVETGVTYLLRQPTDETEIELIDIKNKYQKELDEKSESGVRVFINATINYLLIGWESESVKSLPLFPSDNNPAKIMPFQLKLNLMKVWRESGNFTREEAKK